MTYDSTFFRYVNSGAIKSAHRVLPKLLHEIPIWSVLDVGCGQGAWLSVWEELGVKDTIGVDGDYVQRDALLVEQQRFVAHDLKSEFDLQRCFDLVQSLEVAEHIPAQHACTFVSSLVRHGDLVLFSAAPKGQGGDQHLNEQDYDYWRGLFSRHDYVPFDYIRRSVLDDTSVEPWYRYNTFLYASKNIVDRLPDSIRQHQVGEDTSLPDISPPLYKIRKAFVRQLPDSLVTRLAKIKERVVLARRGFDVPTPGRGHE